MISRMQCQTSEIRLITPWKLAEIIGNHKAEIRQNYFSFTVLQRPPPFSVQLHWFRYDKPVAQGQYVYYVVSDTLCAALHDCEFKWKEAGQRPRRGRSPVEHRGTFVCPFICPFVCPFVRPPAWTLRPGTWSFGPEIWPLRPKIWPLRPSSTLDALTLYLK